MPRNQRKNILITAGSTWVAIDKVRVITNIFSGKTGCLIAEEATKAYAVKLLLGPNMPNLPLANKNLVIKNFKYFDQLQELIKYELNSKHYDIFIHSAAVSDYMPICANQGKIKSDNDELILRLRRTAKLVDQIKLINPNIFLVMFKLEVNMPEKDLIDSAYQSMKRANANIVVANDLSRFNQFIIIDSKKSVISKGNRKKLPGSLLRIISEASSNI